MDGEMKHCLFSVVIPTYRRNDLLARCLDALAPGVQTLSFDSYEVVVTDDGPDGDNAQDMLAERYPWARWTQGPQRGPAANRNHGARQAAADMIVFTDDDCIPEVGWLQAFAEARYSATGNAVLEGKTVCNDWPGSPLWEAPVNLEGGYLWSCNMAVRVDTFQKLGGFDERFPGAAMEDVDFRERLRDAGEAVYFASNAVVNHPARRVPSGRKLGFRHQAEVAYYLKRGITVSRYQLLKKCVNVRLRKIYRHRYRDTLPAVWSLIVELSAICYNYNAWMRSMKNAL